jgi:hypothetical protein
MSPHLTRGYGLQGVPDGAGSSLASHVSISWIAYLLQQFEQLDVIARYAS